MKLGVKCRQCLEQLVHQVAEIATADPELRAKAIEVGSNIVNGRFSHDGVAPNIATEVHRAIRELTGNPDPYRQMKDKELELSQRLFNEVRGYYDKDFRSCVKLSALGNTIDFFKDHHKVSQEMREPVEFAIDNMDKIEEKLKRARNVLYVADNAGECFFDLPLLKKMREAAPVIYVVKGSPVQNDITLEELSQAGLRQEIGKVISIGDTIGVDFSLASEEFKAQFEQADLVFAKGMGNYETLSELPVQGKIAYCLMAKCQPIADTLGVPLNSYVAMLQ